MEARIARLESDVGHLRTDVADIKVDLRALRDKVDSVNENLGARIDKLDHRLSTAMIWALTLYIGLAAMMLATMARGFGWL